MVHSFSPGDIVLMFQELDTFWLVLSSGEIASTAIGYDTSEWLERV
jgi:hypothetical protein